MDNTSKISLKPAQEAFVKTANEEGFTTVITRKDIISLQSKLGIIKPAWLMKDSAYRLGRGSYALPPYEASFVGQVAETTTIESDSE